MSWNDCNNSCNIITTHGAHKIIEAGHHTTLPHVELRDVDGSVFFVSDAPCLKIVIDLNEGGAFVLQRIGTLINHLQILRQETYSSDAIQQLRCAVLCPSPFRVQLSETVELIVCKTCENCQKPEDNRYLMLIAFFLALLTLLYFLSLLCQFWRNWCGGCSVFSASQQQQANSSGPLLTNPQIKTTQPTSAPIPDNQFSDVLLWWNNMCKKMNISDLKIN